MKIRFLNFSCPVFVRVVYAFQIHLSVFCRLKKFVHLIITDFLFKKIFLAECRYGKEGFDIDDFDNRRFDAHPTCILHF